MASNKTSNQTCENQDDNQWPRFLIMEAADQNVPLNSNAFVLKKAIDGMANAELDNVKPMKSGRVFIEVETKQQCKNLLMTTNLLGYLPVKVSPHRTLNSSKFVIKCEELDKMEEDEIKKELQPQGIIAVKRMSILYSLYVLTIKGQNIPKRINIGYLKKETRPYIPNPQRCFQCQKFGHTKNSCKGKPPKVLLLCRSWGACVPRRSQRLCQLEFWLLVGTTMLDRLWARGQTKCNTPLMLATSVFGRIHRRPCYVMAQLKSRLNIPWPNDAECMGHVWCHLLCWYPLFCDVESLAGYVRG